MSNRKWRQDIFSSVAEINSRESLSVKIFSLNSQSSVIYWNVLKNVKSEWEHTAD